MNVTINRLDPNLPDPVESRRRAAGRLVRIAYAIIVFGVLAFLHHLFRLTLRVSQRSRRRHGPATCGVAALHGTGHANEHDGRRHG